MNKLALALGALAATAAQARSGELQYVPIYASRGGEKVDFPLRINGRKETGRLTGLLKPTSQAFTSGRRLGDWHQPPAMPLVETKMREDEARLIREQNVCAERPAKGNYELEIPLPGPDGGSILRFALDDFAPQKTNAVLVRMLEASGEVARHWYMYFCDDLHERQP